MIESKEVEILAKDISDLTPEEKYFIAELEMNPNISFQESCIKRQRYLDDLKVQIDEDIKVLKKLQRRITFKDTLIVYISFFFYSFCSLLWANLFISFLNVLFHLDTITVYPLLVLIYYGIICGLGYLVIFEIWKEKVKKGKLFSWMFFYYIVMVIVGLMFNVNPNLSTYIGHYYAFDDTEYIEDDYYDYDPVYGSSSHGYYVGDNKYFIAENDLNSGIYERGSLSIDINSLDAYLVDEYGNKSWLDINKVTFWQYSFVQGYMPLEGDYKTKGFFSKAFIILPCYFSEMILQQLINGLIFSLIMLLLIALKIIDSKKIFTI